MPAGVVLILYGGVVDDGRTMRFEPTDDPERVLVTMLDAEGERISSVYVSAPVLGILGKVFDKDYDDE